MYPATAAPAGIGGVARPRANFEAITDKRKRTVVNSTIKAEDDTLTASRRKSLTATVHDMERNITLAKWMIDKHCQYVARFKFQAKTKDERFNRELEAFIDDASSPSAFDVSGQLSRQQAFSLVEHRAVADGDAALIKLRSGHTQFIEGYRIAEPHDKSSMPAELQAVEWTSGIEPYVTMPGRARRYCICKSENGRLLFDAVARAVNVLFHAHRWRPAMRGTSLFVGAANTLRDLHEATDLNLIKAKLHALFGAAIIGDEDADTFTIGGNPISTTLTEGTESDDGAGTATHETKTHVMKPGVASVFALDKASKIQLIESATPPSEFIAFCEMMIKIALLAFDIPWIFYDALKGSYSVHRTVMIQYEKACIPKREPLEHLHNRWAAWRIWLATETGEFRLPSRWTMDDVIFEWRPDGTPWIDPLDEVTASIIAIRNGLSTPQGECIKRGLDFFENVDDIAAASAYARDKGLQIEWAHTIDSEVAQLLAITGTQGAQPNE